MTFLNKQNFLKDQYKDSQNLDARIALHMRFSRNKQSWMRWVFEHMDLQPGLRVLELGCGPGTLWAENRERIPAGLRLALSDYSFGMVSTARRALHEVTPAATFGEIDAGYLPFAAGTFDVVIANHMLYHVPDRRRALEEIQRVLRPGGRLCTSTVGEVHLRELDEMARRFDPELDDYSSHLIEFTLENGREQLAESFREIELRRYENALDVTDAEALVAYFASGTRASVTAGRRDEFKAWLEAEMRSRGGSIYITIDSGLFSARK
jgi:ubiquinone/menaquinone biosynthesis C-methylase UbiE